MNSMSGVLEIAMALIGVAILALLVGHASGTAQVIQSATGGFDQLLRTVTLQNGMTTYQ